MLDNKFVCNLVMKISGMQNEASTEEEENTAGPSESADRVRKGILYIILINKTLEVRVILRLQRCLIESR